MSVNFREVYSFDKEGRFISALTDDVHYYRALNHHVTRSVERVIDPAHPTRRNVDRSEVSEPEAREVVRHVHTMVGRAGKDPRFEPMVTRVLAYSFDRLKEDSRRFREIYKDIPMLPPDRYRSLVLKVTEGCSYNHCTFCTLYGDATFRIRTVDEFTRHVDEVKTYFGAGLSRWTSLFLGDANALAMPQADLVAVMDVLREEFPIQMHNGIYAFADTFSSPVRRQADLIQLSRKGLSRVYLGLETACQELLDWVAKPNSPEEVGAMVEKLRSADIHVGLMIIVGLGGREFAENHVAQTVDFVNSLNLGRDDFVYLSPLVLGAHSPYLARAQDRGLGLLNPEELEKQMEQFKQMIRRDGEGYPKVARYDLTRFAY